MRFLILYVGTIYACSAQSHNDPPLFDTARGMGALANDQINEASGLEASFINSGLLWTHNDSGDTARLFLIREDGTDAGEFYLKGVVSRDWEDITLGPGPEADQSYIYVGETGDNRAVYEQKYIYRFKEPELGGSSLVSEYDVIEFRYPDGKRDAECLMIDPLTKDLYIISKRERQVHVYRLPYPQKTDAVNTLIKLGTLPYRRIVAGDISMDGTEIILKTYKEILYWKRSAGESVFEAISRVASFVPYQREPQGEAIAWKSDGSGFYTLSEEPNKIESQVYYYKRR